MPVEEPAKAITGRSHCKLRPLPAEAIADGRRCQLRPAEVVARGKPPWTIAVADQSQRPRRSSQAEAGAGRSISRPRPLPADTIAGRNHRRPELTQADAIVRHSHPSRPTAAAAVAAGRRTLPPAAAGRARPARCHRRDVASRPPNPSNRLFSPRGKPWQDRGRLDGGEQGDGSATKGGSIMVMH